MSPTLLDARARRSCRPRGAASRSIVPVDMLRQVRRLRRDRPRSRSAAGARLLCDAAESFGATYGGRAAGSFGDASVVSFNGNKIMTTSGGGMLLTDDARLADHVRKLSTQAREPVAHYEHTEIGYNYRLSNILAALGRAQLVRLDDMMKRRREWRERYRALFADQPGVRILGGADDAGDNCWLTADRRRPRRVARGPRRDLGGRPRAGRHRDAAGVEADAPPAGLAGLRRDARRLVGAASSTTA